MIEFDEFSKPAMGGTEIIKYELQKRLPQELLNRFQIICDRVTELNQNKIRLYLILSDLLNLNRIGHHHI